MIGPSRFGVNNSDLVTRGQIAGYMHWIFSWYTHYTSHSCWMPSCYSPVVFQYCTSHKSSSPEAVRNYVLARLWIRSHHFISPAEFADFTSKIGAQWTAVFAAPMAFLDVILKHVDAGACKVRNEFGFDTVRIYSTPPRLGMEQWTWRQPPHNLDRTSPNQHWSACPKCADLLFFSRFTFCATAKICSFSCLTFCQSSPELGSRVWSRPPYSAAPLCHKSVQDGAPKIAKLVYKWLNNGLW